MRTETLTDLVDILDDAAPIHSGYGSALSALEVELERRRAQVTRHRLQSEEELERYRWRAGIGGQLITMVRHDISIEVRWTEDREGPPMAYALVVNRFGNHRVRCNLDCMHDLDELIRLFAVPPIERGVDVLQ